MKKFYVMLSMMLALGTSTFAIPVQKGIKKVLTLADGSQVMAEMRGDEFLSWWEGEDGKAYVENGSSDVYHTVDLEALKPAAEARRAKIDEARASRLARVRKNVGKGSGEMRADLGGSHIQYTGKKKGLIILAQFPDKQFKDTHTLSYYKDVANKPGFTNGEGYVGSVRDYFYDQSNGQFELDFDVLGPVMAKNSYAYYGKDGSQVDINVGELIKECCDAVSDQVNFSDYDWDGDGTADQVFVLYAGLGQAAGGDATTIWPHEYVLRQTSVGVLSYPTGKVDTYACAQELSRRPLSSGGFGKTDYASGIGTICHEFSHCLGFADMYDTNGQKNYAMSYWDIMDSGAYNGNSFIPCNYTGFERIYAGWTEPIVLDEPATVKSMKSMSDFGRPFIMYNDRNKDEAYIFDNRQKTGWDRRLYGEGLLITHLDYNAYYWRANSVNTISSHQRCTIFHADNSAGVSLLQDFAGDPYPYEYGGEIMNDELTDDSEPAASLFNRNSDNTYYMGKPVTQIRRNGDGTISFLVMDGDDDNVLDNSPVVDAISSVSANVNASDSRIFSIDGRYLGSDASKLGKDLYIIGGKKVVK